MSPFYTPPTKTSGSSINPQPIPQFGPAQARTNLRHGFDSGACKLMESTEWLALGRMGWKFLSRSAVLCVLGPEYLPQGLQGNRTISPDEEKRPRGHGRVQSYHGPYRTAAGPRPPATLKVELCHISKWGSWATWFRNCLRVRVIMSTSVPGIYQQTLVFCTSVPSPAGFPVLCPTGHLTYHNIASA